MEVVPPEVFRIVTVRGRVDEAVRRGVVQDRGECRVRIPKPGLHLKKKSKPELLPNVSVLSVSYSFIRGSEGLRPRGELRVEPFDDGLFEGLRISALRQHLGKQVGW